MSYIDKRNQVDLLQLEINSHGELSPEIKKKINYKFRLDWNYYSNSMEGNTLTMEETRSVMVGNLTVGGKPIKDVLEMKGHDEVISEIIKVGKGESRLSEAKIKAIHKGIMHEEDEEKKKKIGIWKTSPNHVINYKGEKFEFAPPAEVAERMHQLLDKTNAAIDAIKQNKKDAPHPIDVAMEFHLEYVSIHPFYDGNGRTARILTNLLLISFGYPPFWVKTDERKTYNQYIADIQGYGGKPDLFYEFAAALLIRSQQLVINAIEGKEIEETEDLDKKLAILRGELADVDVDNRVQQEFSKKVFIEIYDSWLTELLKGLVIKINKFNEFFASPTHFVSINTNQHNKRGGQTVSLYFTSIDANEFVNELKSQLLTQAPIIHSETSVTVHAKYGTFKTGALISPFGCNYHVKIFFDFIKYEIYLRKFIPGLNSYPVFSEDLKNTLVSNSNIKVVHFDANGNHYFNVHKKDDGTLYVNKENIIISYPAEDILKGKIANDGMIRLIEPRLLHKPLTKNEIEDICTQMGNTIFEHIDYYTRIAGLR